MFAGTLWDDWKVPPDQNRGCGPVVTRKMTPEEWAKYGPPAVRKKHDIAAVKYMVKAKAGQNKKITKEKLLEECRLLGTDRTACENIAEKYGYSHYSAVQQRIRVWGIREILKREKDTEKREVRLRKMEIKDKTLIIYPHDFDHIMCYEDGICPSEVFKKGLRADLFMNGLEDKEFNEVKLMFDWENKESEVEHDAV